MSVKKWYPRVTILLTLFCLALLPAAAFAAKDNPPAVSPAIQFDCEQKAAAFSRKMGKPGNTDLVKQHFDECMDVNAPQVPPTAPPDPPKIDCPAKQHAFSFLNKSGETAWIGVWNVKDGSGMAAPNDKFSDQWPNWKLEDGATKSVCMKEGFKGRFIIRTKCDDTTNVCGEGNCCSEGKRDECAQREKCFNDPTCKEGKRCGENKSCTLCTDEEKLANKDACDKREACSKNPACIAMNKCAEDKTCTLCTDKEKLAGSCNGMICNAGAEPSSLVEFFLDDEAKDSKKTPAPLTWYDVSYVDGYNLPVRIDSNDQGCISRGQGNLPDCPWKTINGVCFAPYEQYPIDSPTYLYEQAYYTLAARCAAPGNVCGCGNQCNPDIAPKSPLPQCENKYTLTHPINGDVDIYSSGCSPINNYELHDKDEKPIVDGDGKPLHDELALQQVVCDPSIDYPNLTAQERKDKNISDKLWTKCKTAGSPYQWPEKYRKYVTNIQGRNISAYTWQYDDKNSLASCPLREKQAFVMTIGARPANRLGNAFVVDFRPSATYTDKGTTYPGATGAITVKSGSSAPESINFGNGIPFKRAIPEGAAVTIASNCSDNKMMTCTGTYDPKAGLVYIPKTKINSQTGNQENADTSDCDDPNSNMGWAKKDKPSNLFTLSMPAAAICKPADKVDLRKFKLQLATTSGSVVITPPDGKSPETLNFQTTDKSLEFYLGHDYKVTINNMCNDGKTPLSRTATYKADQGLVADEGSACPAKTDPASCGFVWNNSDAINGSKRELAIGAPTDKACWNFTFFKPLKYKADMWKNGTPVPIKEDPQGAGAIPESIKLNLAENDKIKLKIACSEADKFLNCDLQYLAQTDKTKKLILTQETSDENCSKAANWSKETDKVDLQWPVSYYNYMIHPPANFSALLWQTKKTEAGESYYAPLPNIEGKDYGLSLKRDDSIQVVLNCSQRNETMTCYAKYDGTALKLDTANSDGACSNLDDKWATADGAKDLHPKSTGCYNFTIYAPGDFKTDELWKNSVQLENIKGGDYSLGLKKDDTVKMVVPCGQGTEKMTCTAKYDGSVLKLDTANSDVGCPNLTKNHWADGVKELHPEANACYNYYLRGGDLFKANIYRNGTKLTTREGGVTPYGLALAENDVVRMEFTCYDFSKNPPVEVSAKLTCSGKFDKAGTLQYDADESKTASSKKYCLSIVNWGSSGGLNPSPPAKDQCE